MSDDIYVPFSTNAGRAAREIRRAGQETDRAARSADRFEREQKDISRATEKTTREIRQELRELAKLNQTYDRTRRGRSGGGRAVPGAGMVDASGRNAAAGRLASLAGAIGGGPLASAFGAGVGAAGGSRLGVGLGIAAGGLMALVGTIQAVSTRWVQAARDEIRIRQQLRDVVRQGREQVGAQGIAAATAIDPTLRRLHYRLGGEAAPFYGSFRDQATRVGGSESEAVGLLEDISRFSSGNRRAAMDLATIVGKTGLIPASAILDGLTDNRIGASARSGQGGLRELAAQIVSEQTGQPLARVRGRMQAQRDSAAPLGVDERDRIRVRGAIGRMDRLGDAEGAMRSELARELEPAAALMTEWYREQAKALEAQRAAAEAQSTVAAAFQNLGLLFGGEGSETQKLLRMQSALGAGVLPEGD
jgi:hypothetical protein